MTTTSERSQLTINEQAKKIFDEELAKATEEVYQRWLKLQKTGKLKPAKQEQFPPAN